jgi:hypothetical protein
MHPTDPLCTCSALPLLLPPLLPLLLSLRFPVQCPVGSSTFRYGYQGGNPWYRKMMVANARVPVRNVQIMQGGAWKPLTKTIDNYWEFHGDTAKVCATYRSFVPPGLLVLCAVASPSTSRCDLSSSTGASSMPGKQQ